MVPWWPLVRTEFHRSFRGLRVSVPVTTSTVSRGSILADSTGVRYFGNVSVKSFTFAQRSEGLRAGSRIWLALFLVGKGGRIAKR